jgi:FKBP12-rapamycin complex-associated protein
MSVLRANKESLMAVLEAFVYDPLINWRLMQADVDSRRPEGASYFVVIRLGLHE